MFEDIIAKCRGSINPDHIGYIHVAVIFKNRHTITHIKFNDYLRTCINGKLVTAMHAEHNCCKKYNKIKGNFLVLRFCRRGILKDSRPCSLCRDLLLSKGLKHIYCSTESGKIIKINLTTLGPYNSNAQLKFYKNKKGSYYKFV